MGAAYVDGPQAGSRGGCPPAKAVARSAAFGPLVDAFRRWARPDEEAGWQLGDALANAAVPDDLPVMLDLVCETGTAQRGE